MNTNSQAPKLIQLCPADDYYLVIGHPLDQTTQQPTVWRVACWGVQDDGTAIPLVPVNDSNRIRLVGPPPNALCLHFYELTDEYKTLAMKDGMPASFKER